MQTSLRIVTRLPLEELWLESGETAGRVAPLKQDDIRRLLRAGVVQFVLADVGFPLRWVPLSECFAFWKGEAKVRIAPDDEGVRLEQFPGEYFYFASRWDGGEKRTPPIVLLEKNH